MSQSTKYCLVTDTGERYRSNTVIGAVADYLNPFVLSRASHSTKPRHYEYKYCVVCKDGSGKYYGDSLPALLTDIAIHRTGHLLSGEGWRD